MTDPTMTKIFEFMSGDKFEMVMKGFAINPSNAQDFLEVCEECRISIESDPPGFDWRNLPPREISGLAQTMAQSLRKHFFSH